jgi:hypothetical protein
MSYTHSIFIDYCYYNYCHKLKFKNSRNALQIFLIAHFKTFQLFKRKHTWNLHCARRVIETVSTQTLLVQKITNRSALCAYSTILLLIINIWSSTYVNNLFSRCSAHRSKVPFAVRNLLRNCYFYGHNYSIYKRRNNNNKWTIKMRWKVVCNLKKLKLSTLTT